MKGGGHAAEVGALEASLPPSCFSPCPGGVLSCVLLTLWSVIQQCRPHPGACLKCHSLPSPGPLSQKPQDRVGDPCLKEPPPRDTDTPSSLGASVLAEGSGAPARPTLWFSIQILSLLIW